jgi:DNA-binding transcriptional regulator YdaS (Cro superfamily)
MRHFNDPKIDVDEAIEIAGSQAKLAALLGIDRSSVNEWKKSNRKYLPLLQAYRFQQIKAAKSSSEAA